MASNILPLPLQTPQAMAKLGIKQAPANQAARLCQSELRRSRIPTPPPVNRETITPAVQSAGSWRPRLRAQEKSNDSVPKRASRLPICDQTRMGQIQAAIRIPPREAFRGVTRQAIESPAATMYHHQRWPWSIRRNSAATRRKNGLLVLFSNVTLRNFTVCNIP